jgi:hypothetical protein
MSNKLTYNKIVCFDFDGTLCHTHNQIEGEKIFKEKTGLDWPYTGWWSKPESLDMDIFNIQVNQWVYRKYLEAVAEENTYVILATGRIEKLRSEVETVLNHHNLSFNEVLLNWGSDTFNFKCKAFENLINRLKVKEFTMYDDRYDHLNRFKTWAIGQKACINIININNKELTLIQNTK